MIDLSTLFSSPVVQWALPLLGLALIFIIVRYFFHIVAHIFTFVLHFFWHGCFTAVAILLLLYILHAFNLI
jgi:hypothetical protein